MHTVHATIGLRHPNPAVRRRRVAVASLMWGYGITGTRCGSWVTDISNFLSPGLGFPFITKIFYFRARNSPDDTPAEYPLVLDTEVPMALAQLTGYRLLVRPADYRPRPESPPMAARSPRSGWCACR